jgi:hypothetical protein
MKDLLSINNHKTIKSLKFKTRKGLPYITYIMYLSPFKQNSKGINLCPHASKGCSESCLFESGFGGIYDEVKQGRINRTELFLRDKVGFMERIKFEIERAISKHKGEKEVVIRLNGTSDIVFEKFKVFNGKNIFEIFPRVQFYDYTKNPKRFENDMPKNYHLTFSRSESNHAIAMELLSKGVNVAMVFNKLPKTYKGYKVVNGDESDLRFKDKRGVIVGLKYKYITGKGGNEKNKKAFKSGFAIDITGETIKKYEIAMKQFMKENLLVS